MIFKILLFLLLSGFIVWVIALVSIYLLQDSLIFVPQRTNDKNYEHFKDYEIKIHSQDIDLYGWFFKNEISQENPLIVYFGGNSEDISYNLPHLNKIDSKSFLYINYRSYGKSQGNASQENLYKDSVAILEYLESLEIDLKNVVLIGRSLGTGVAIYAASQKEVKAVILVTPYDSILNVAKNKFPIFPVSYLLKHNFESIKYAPKILAPKLILVAPRDEVIKYTHIENLKKYLTNYKEITIPKADHNDIVILDDYFDEINKFLKSLRN